MSRDSQSDSGRMGATNTAYTMAAQGIPTEIPMPMESEGDYQDIFPESMEDDSNPLGPGPNPDAYEPDNNAS